MSHEGKPKYMTHNDVLLMQTAVLSYYPVKCKALSYLSRHLFLDIRPVSFYSLEYYTPIIWDCHQSLTQLARQNKVQLIWVPEHEGIVGNGTAD
jgi:hypothetical protein